jgi:hypothetical protein
MPDQSEHLGIVVGVDGSTSSTAAVAFGGPYDIPTKVLPG